MFLTGQNHFPRHKDEQHDARFHHAVDEAWKQLWLITADNISSFVNSPAEAHSIIHQSSVSVPAELLVGQHQSFQSDGETHITAGHHVLDLEVHEASWKT